jgi:hypothetical protein
VVQGYLHPEESSSKASVIIFKSTWCHIPDDFDLQKYMWFVQEFLFIDYYCAAM